DGRVLRVLPGPRGRGPLARVAELREEERLRGGRLRAPREELVALAVPRGVEGVERRAGLLGELEVAREADVIERVPEGHVLEVVPVRAVDELSREDGARLLHDRAPELVILAPRELGADAEDRDLLLGR